MSKHGVVRERLFVIWEGMYQLSMSTGASILSHSRGEAA